MDCSDLRDALNGLGVDLSKKRVADIGCGTGRLSQLCREYVGWDISEGAVEYATSEGFDARLMRDIEDVEGEFDMACCMSVFTHIGRSSRQKYLAHLRGIATELVADILPGEESGSPAAWYANTAEFRSDLEGSGWTLQASYERISPDKALHLYHYCL